jgi:WD40 repeat protein
VLGGKQLASAGGDNVIRLWQLPAQADGALTQAKEIPGHTQPVTCLEAFPADGKQLLSGSRDGSVRHWSVESAKQVRQMDHGAPVLAVAVAPNGKTFASAGGNSARLWSAEKGQQLSEMKGDHRAGARIGQSEQALAFAKNEVAYWKTTLEAAAKTQSAKADAVKKATDAIATAEKTVAEKRAAQEKVTEDKDKAAAEDAVKKAEAAKTNADNGLKAAQLAAKQAEQSVTDAKAAADKAAAALQKAEAGIEQAKKALADSEKPIRAVAFAPSGLTVATAGDDQIIHTWSAETGAGFDTFPSQLGPCKRSPTPPTDGSSRAPRKMAPSSGAADPTGRSRAPSAPAMKNRRSPTASSRSISAPTASCWPPAAAFLRAAAR